MFAGLEARKKKPRPGTRRAQAQTGHAKARFCLGPGINFWHPVRSRVVPNSDRTRGFAKPRLYVGYGGFARIATLKSRYSGPSPRTN